MPLPISLCQRIEELEAENKSLRQQLDPHWGMRLTAKQRAILLFIDSCNYEDGYSPTLQGIADEIGISKVTVFEHLKALEHHGALTKQYNATRGIKITPAGECYLSAHPADE